MKREDYLRWKESTRELKEYYDRYRTGKCKTENLKEKNKMKKRIVSIMALSLVIAMGTSSLTGCGNKETANYEETPVIAEAETPAPTEVEASESTSEATATPEPTPIATPEPTETPEPEVTVVEVIDISDGERITGTETRYSDGTSDYEISLVGILGTGSYEVKGLESGMVVKAYSENCRLTYESKEDGVYRGYAIWFRPWANTDNMDLKNLSDEEIMKLASPIPDPATFQRIETETVYEAIVQYNDEDKQQVGFDRFINNYETGKAYNVWVETLPVSNYPDVDTLKEICTSINIID